MRSLLALIIATLFLASCSSTYEASAPYDEVYAAGDPGTKVYTQERVKVDSDPVTESSQYEGDYYSSEYTSEDFDSEGYYDYEYASRIKRFGETGQGFDYYDSYYTDSYQYSGNPNNYGTTIYNGCGGNCYNSCYSCGSGLSLSFGVGFGWGYGYWGYPSYGWHDPWYRPWYWHRPYWGYYPPYYGYYPPYYGGSYWNGYWNGYYDGYYAAGGGYYPGDYYGRGNYYGARSSVGRASDGSGYASARGFRDAGSENVNNGSGAKAQPITRTSRDQVGAGQANRGNEATATRSNMAEPTASNSRTVERAAATGATTATREKPATTREPARSEATRKVDLSTKPATRETKAYNKPAQTRSNVNTGASRQGNSYSNATRKVELPEQKYQKPKTYTSPKVRTTPSSREYASPSSKNTRGFSNETRKTYVATPQRKAVSETQSSSSRNPSYSFPSRSQSRNYTAPTRSSNSRSYSSPARSNTRSYSAPSRSYSPSSSSRSSGSSVRSSGATRSSGGGASRGGRK